MKTRLGLKGIANVFYMLGTGLLITGMILTFMVQPVSAVAGAGDYQLNLSHIACVDGQVEIHFVLLNVPDGITPGTLTYTYGTIQPGAHTGNVWHYTAYVASGYYDVTSASVVVDGVTVYLHNPDAYAGTYDCGPAATATSTLVPTQTFAPTATATATATFIPTETFRPTETILPTLTFTPTATLLPTETATTPVPPTATLTATATLEGTESPTPTSVSFYDLTFAFVCSLQGTTWHVTNPNMFDVTFSYSVNGGSVTDFTAPAGAMDLIFASAAPTTGQLNVSYVLNGVSKELSVVKTTACEINQPTPTPKPSQQSTLVPTLSAPRVLSTASVLIPVTGTDLMASSKASSGSSQSTLFELGAGFLGIGMIFQGASKRKNK
jgi:hypothetical protein